MSKEVACPRCGTRHAWDGNPYRPFCSERCKLIDFGGWLGGKNAIPGEPVEIPDGEIGGDDRGDSPLQH